MNGFPYDEMDASSLVAPLVRLFIEVNGLDPRDVA